MLYLIMALGMITVLFLFYRNRKRTQAAPEIETVYQSKEGRFEVKGRKQNFTVTKDKNFEFLVCDGQIVAVKDKRRATEFVFYGGDE